MVQQKHTVLSGMQASGLLHLGNYHGALENWVKLQDDYRCFFFVADWHALTTLAGKPEQINRYSLEVAIDFLACGIDPQKSAVFLQSSVLQHAELSVLLGMLTPVPWLERVPSYKDKKQQLKNHDLSSIGFLGYPVLQAADIALYRARYVPVGEDQLPHLELAREIVRRFNHMYEPVLVEPLEIVTPTPVLPGLDGRKMSKSYGNAVYLSDPDDEVVRKFRNAVTDPQRQRRKDPGRPEVCNIYAYHKLYTAPGRLKEIDQACRTAGIGCVDCKKELIERFFERFEQIRKRRRELEGQEDYINGVLRDGRNRALEEAEQTMKLVRKAMGLYDPEE
ncbi:MAG: tryptophan--tRNA ligase [Deltaproteobacteria bacterium]|nr:MAG: tryptophan--tRNA ligase [Deltaproteobacteria bacterium]